jgi:hypothetical protein
MMFHFTNQSNCLVSLSPYSFQVSRTFTSHYITWYVIYNPSPSRLTTLGHHRHLQTSFSNQSTTLLKNIMDVEMATQRILDEEEVEILLSDETSTGPTPDHPLTLQEPIRGDTAASDVLVVPGTERRIAQPPPSTTHVAPQPPASAPDLEASPSKTQGQVAEKEGKERKCRPVQQELRSIKHLVPVFITADHSKGSLAHMINLSEINRRNGQLETDWMCVQANLESRIYLAKSSIKSVEWEIESKEREIKSTKNEK